MLSRKKVKTDTEQADDNHNNQQDQASLNDCDITF
jgi:hypothetical protein